ncbi:hypothetical protein KUTeg_014615 [Tegillarca granosa]|uniref:Uncharacterized protein n=1 Tax=Tegillarca granosa TaxID=220873 RepID=A0ABQ9EV50_TEGGR|nr:hypothetical protein KUTeg_014615 [Tegillarca granosa]
MKVEKIVTKILLKCEDILLVVSVSELSKGQNAAEHFIDNMIQEENYIKNILANPEPLIMNEETEPTDFRRGLINSIKLEGTCHPRESIYCSDCHRTLQGVAGVVGKIGDTDGGVNSRFLYCPISGVPAMCGDSSNVKSKTPDLKKKKSES